MDGRSGRKWVARVVAAFVVSVGLVAVPSAAHADATIDTIAQTDFNVMYFAQPETPTYGQVVTVPAGESSLSSFTFVMNQPSSLTFRGEVYAWDGSKATGPNLYESAPRTTAGTGSEQVTFSTGGVPVTAGSKYVIFASISKDFEASSGFGSWAASTSDIYPGGTFVYLSDVGDESKWTTTSWSTFAPAPDLGFRAVFTAPASAPAFSSPSAALSGQVGEAFSYTPSVTGTAPVTFKVSPNANFPDQLPASLSLNTDTGEVTGTPVPGDVGTYKIRLRAHNDVGNDFQRVTITIDKGDITGLSPTISGLAQQGQTLTADPGGPFEPPNVDLSYQWNADGVPIAGETGQTLRLRRAQAGAQITVSVTASSPGYNTVTQTSAPAPYVRERVRYPMVSAPRSVHRGGTVTVLGQGLTPGGTYTVSLGLLGASATATADQYGEIHAPLTIPSDARTGKTIVTLTGPGPVFTTTTVRIRR